MTLMILLAALAIVICAGPLGILATHAVGRADLLGAFEEFNLQDQEGGFVADQVFPDIGVPDDAANFPAVTRESGTNLEANIKIGIDGKYPTMTFSTRDKAYACEEYGVRVRLADKQVVKLSEQYGIPVDEVAGRIVWHQVRLQYEKRVADIAFDPVVNFTAGQGNYSDVSSSAPWTTTTSDVLGTIQAAQEARYGATGMVPMDLLVNYTNFNRLLRNTTVRDMVGDARDKTVQAIAGMLAPGLGLRKIHVGRAVYNATPFPGPFVGTKLYSNLYALVFLNNEDRNLVAPRLGITCRWLKDSPQIVVLDEYRDEETRSDCIRARHNIDELLLDNQFGHLVKVAAS